MIPRVVIAGTSSGAGKTSVTCGVIGALRRRELTVQGFKVGPDYIDPSYHTLASGRPGRNLDAFLGGPELIAPLVSHGMQGADVVVVEGVMGLFDGASSRGELASTGHVAKLLGAPVVLVVDASAMARSVAAVVHGYRTFDPEINVAGVIFNKVGSDYHEQLLREAVAPLGAPVLGAFHRDERVSAPERHLGLVPASEQDQRTRAALHALADAAARAIDLDALLALGRAAPELDCVPWSPMARTAAGGSIAQTAAGGSAQIAVARGPAFCFHYRENLELLEAAGAELLPFDPLSDERLPAGAGALVLAGGFPEVFGPELAANAPMRAAVATFAATGRPILAECGGLLFLCEDLDGHAMCGVLPARARMTGRLSLGYRDATAATTTPWIEAGERVRGHEFHYSEIVPGRDRGSDPAWSLAARGQERAEGFVAGAVQASYLHVHWAAHPELAYRFVSAASAGSAVSLPAA
jgi:cobyrinic acid a,c-diamide synthase